MSNWFLRAFGRSDAQKEIPRPSLSAVSAAKTDAPAWEIGSMLLDDYLIVKELGCGGMGRVWLVMKYSTRRRFAVKQTLIKDEKHRKAFLTELQTWIDLPEHPNILPCRFFRTVGEEIVIFAAVGSGNSAGEIPEILSGLVDTPA